MATATATKTAPRAIKEIARDIRIHWKNVHYSAKPYLSAMMMLTTVKDSYGDQTGDDIVLRFLGNASTFKGPEAQALKAELKRHLA